MDINNEKNNTEIVKDTYNSIAEYFAPILTVDNSSIAEVEFMDRFISKLSNRAIVLDLGCGVGKHGRYCASKGCCVTGCDVSERMIELAKSYNNQYEMQFLHVADMRVFKSDICFDAVVAMYSFIHLTYEQAKETLLNIKSFLKPNAKIAFTVYYGDRNGLYDEALLPEKKQYYRDYTQEELEKLIIDTGFNIEHVQLWNDEDDITASNDDMDFGVIGLIASI